MSKHETAGVWMSKKKVDLNILTFFCPNKQRHTLHWCTGLVGKYYSRALCYAGSSRRCPATQQQTAADTAPCPTRSTTRRRRARRSTRRRSMKRRRSNWLPSIPNCDQWNLPVVNRWWPQKLPECIVCDGRKNVLKSDSAPSYRLFFLPTVITSTFAVFRNEVVLAFLLISTFFLSCCYSCFISPQRQIMGSLWQKPNWSPLTPPKDSGSTGPCKQLKQDKQANKNCFLLR